MEPRGVVQRLPDSDVDGRRSMGMTLFLVSSTMMFGGLLLLHALLRRDAAAWPRPDAVPLALAATAAIAASSATLEAGVRAVLRARPRHLPRWLFATIALGLAFLAIEVCIWIHLWRGGFVPGSPPSGTFYFLTTFHFAHVVIAIGLLAWLVPGALHERYHANEHVRVRLVARFWHFLGINWALLFLALFVL